MTSSLFFPVSLVSVPFQPCPLHGTRHPCRDGTGARSLVHRFHADTRRHTQLPLAVSCSTAGPDRPVRRRSSARAVVSTLSVTRDIYPTRVLITRSRYIHGSTVLFSFSTCHYPRGSYTAIRFRSFRSVARRDAVAPLVFPLSWPTTSRTYTSSAIFVHARRRSSLSHRHPSPS